MKGYTKQQVIEAISTSYNATEHDLRKHTSVLERRRVRSAQIRRKVSEKVSGIVSSANPKKRAEAINAAADIAARGVQVPVEYDEHGNILDGHHRVCACQELIERAQEPGRLDGIYM